MPIILVLISVFLFVSGIGVTYFLLKQRFNKKLQALKATTGDNHKAQRVEDATVKGRVSDENLHFEAEKKKLEEKNKKLFQMSEAVYKEKKRVDEELDKLRLDKNKLEEDKKKFEDKNKKLWQQSLAIHKEKERIDVVKREIEQKHKDIMDSISYAKRIQEAILTSADYMNNVLDSYFVLFKPRDVVSGDFYWVYKTKDDEVIAAVADCTGHGVPGAFMSMIGIALLNELVIEKNVGSVNEILDGMRIRIIQSLKQTGMSGESRDGMDIALVKFDWKNKKLYFAGANNPLWILRELPEQERAQGASGYKIIELPADKQPVGFQEAMGPFKESSFDLQENDFVYLFSDGYADQFGGPKGKKFKYRQLEETLLNGSHFHISEQKKILEDTFYQWKGSLEQIDDVTMLGIHVSPKLISAGRN